MALSEFQGEVAFHDSFGVVTVEWVTRGPVKVSPTLVEEFVNATNEMRRLTGVVAGLKADNDTAWREIQALRTMDERNVSKIVALLEANAEMAAGLESFAAEIESLRAVLSQLIDATRVAQYSDAGIDVARAAAVSVLKGPET